MGWPIPRRSRDRREKCALGARSADPCVPRIKEYNRRPFFVPSHRRKHTWKVSSNSLKRVKRVWVPKKQSDQSTSTTLESLGPPVQTFIANHDFLVVAPTVNSFTVPNCLTSTDPHSGRFISNSLKIHDSVREFDDVQLSEGGKKVKFTPNAGGNSVASEVISYEVLRSCYGAELLRTEMELDYFPMGGKITDYSVQMYGLHIGVSVTRAMKYGGIFNEQDAKRLLKKKLYGVNESSRLVLEPFHKQILHIITEAEYMVDVLRNVYDKLKPELTSDTLVVVTVAEKNADWVFYGSSRSKDLSASSSDCDEGVPS
eukprot:CAMPEP_0174260344 /NCGR_PEP_ID=MMETSP0439-20130205/9655_1 /TAXON_ID=0 /ORGANISM="Stereomyxa ramosa, Strain Chinc5" /LENGTH=313 /DNA_ID=CAMNT_0015344567 /DNA_START=266 /DNA_END=1207 /DNA_ORIENTATION=+